MAFIRKHVRATESGFGGDVRELRELRGLTKEALGKSCGMHPSFIADLEEERFENFTDPAYAERHVRAIAKALEASPVFLLKKFHAALEARGLDARSKVLPGGRIRRRDLFVTSNFVGVAALLLFGAFVGSYVFWQAYLVSNVPNLTVVTPAEGLQIDRPRTVVSGKTDPEAQVTVNGDPAIVDPDGRFQAEIGVPRGLSTITVQARHRYSRSNTVERHVLFEENSSPL